MTPLRRIQPVLDAVRDVRTAEELDAAEREADEIFRAVLGEGVAGKLPDGAIATFDMAMTELRSRIAARRQALATG
jgi:hypothetical protein